MSSDKKNIDTDLISDDMIQFCTFRLSNRLFGTNILDVKEVNADKINFTQIFHANRAIKGYMNLRGQMYLVIDMRPLFSFGEEETEITPDTRVLIFKNEVDDYFGILVDKIEDVVAIKEDDIVERRKESKTIDTDRRKTEQLTLGVSTLEKELMVVLNARGIIPALNKSKGQVEEIR